MSGQIERIAEEAEHLATTSESLRALVAQFRLGKDASPAVLARTHAEEPAPKRVRRASY